MLISEQLDLAGWDTAWLHEKRGRGGEWVKSLPGGYSQATFPGMPRGADPPAWEEAGRQLDTDMVSGIKAESVPHAARGLAQGGGGNFFGNSAETAVVTFANGHKWVRKRELPDWEYQNEVLASRVSDAIGAGAPPVIRRDGDYGGEIWEPFLKGAKPAIVWEGGQDEDGLPLNEDHDPYEMYTSENGVRIGILDNLLGNGDRHEGNWMVVHDRKTGMDSPRPIDHGRLAFDRIDASRNYLAGSGNFGEFLIDDPQPLGEIPQDQWDAWRRKLAATQPGFDEDGRTSDYQVMMHNLDVMEKLARESRPS